eukprot:jgi/Tetstr1/424368/TSEL_014930.t1
MDDDGDDDEQYYSSAEGEATEQEDDLLMARRLTEEEFERFKKEAELRTDQSTEWTEELKESLMEFADIIAEPTDLPPEREFDFEINWRVMNPPKNERGRGTGSGCADGGVPDKRQGAEVGGGQAAGGHGLRLRRMAGGGGKKGLRPAAETDGRRRRPRAPGCAVWVLEREPGMSCACREPRGRRPVAASVRDVSHQREQLRLQFG